MTDCPKNNKTITRHIKSVPKNMGKLHDIDICYMSIMSKNQILLTCRAHTKNYTWCKVT